MGRNGALRRTVRTAHAQNGCTGHFPAHALSRFTGPVHDCAARLTWADRHGNNAHMHSTNPLQHKQPRFGMLQGAGCRKVARMRLQRCMMQTGAKGAQLTPTPQGSPPPLYQSLPGRQNYVGNPTSPELHFQGNFCCSAAHSYIQIRLNTPLLPACDIRTTKCTNTFQMEHLTCVCGMWSLVRIWIYLGVW